MTQSNQLIDALKLELKHQGKTYEDLEEVLSLSHASVKRLFAEGSFTLERIEKICDYLGIDLVGLVTLIEHRSEKIDQLTVQQEEEFANDAKLLCFAHCLLNGWSFDEITQTYDISEHEGINMMAKLDRMKLINMLPGNRYTLLISRKFSWIKSGPTEKYFERQLQSEFFDSKFDQQHEVRLFATSTLSDKSIDIIKNKIGKLANELNDLHLEDEKLPLDQKRGMSMLLSLRPWETKVFKALRRDNK
ncbi:MAG: helix-turn-helix transcriptional regulator [Gammaproteobacteria bacterium]|jgi:transcriptional regulator with XRE-family HTH domain|nr:helix-turn-helix transcriptional regulator [Gammaproteobacteria bacterium]|tara:strand:+ start:96 stop:836 length:741 start_codon:yes stop_codon:yes gene_type:complete